MMKDEKMFGAYFPPGTPVRYDGMEDGPEFGVVVHCWFDDEVHAHDCYVAFFGDTQPIGKPAEKPYILRYASTSLKKTSCSESG